MLSVAALVVASSMVVGQTKVVEPRHKELKAIQPFIGKWRAESELFAPIEGAGKTGDKVTWDVEYAWTKNQNGISVHVTAGLNGKTLELTDGIIAWDPQKKQIVGIDCYADGGINRYTIKIDGTRLTYTGQGALADGTPTSSTITDILENSNTIRAQFTNRKEGEKTLPDGPVIVLKRVLP